MVEEPRKNEVDGIQMIMNMVVFDIIPVHILNRQMHHRIYRTHRNECHRIMIVQYTITPASMERGGAKGKMDFLMSIQIAIFLTLQHS